MSSITKTECKVRYLPPVNATFVFVSAMIQTISCPCCLLQPDIIGGPIIHSSFALVHPPLNDVALTEAIIKQIANHICMRIPKSKHCVQVFYLQQMPRNAIQYRYLSVLNHTIALFHIPSHNIMPYSPYP